MLLNPNLKVELFDVWVINFMEHFMSSYENKYFLVVVDYLPKWMKAIVLINNERKGIMFFLKDTNLQGLGLLK